MVNAPGIIVPLRESGCGPFSLLLAHAPTCQSVTFTTEVWRDDFV